MPEQQSTSAADVAVLIILGGALLIGIISISIGHIVVLCDWLHAWWRTGIEQAERERWRRDMSSRTEHRYEPTAEPEPARSASEPPGTAFGGSANPEELVLNADEITAVTRMIEHKTTAARPSKSSTIQAGFGVSRGGSATYQRASLIYDALFGVPQPAVPAPQYRDLDKDSRPVLR